jgi:TRAP-type C4-dicarboxylate transport system permease small subunit
LNQSNDPAEYAVKPGFAPPSDDRTSTTRFLTFLNEISGYLLFFMMLLITVDVTGRYVFSSPIPGTLELTEFLIVFVVFFSIAYVQLTKRHICVELVTQRLPRRAADGLAVVVLVIAAVFFALVCWQSWNSAVSSLEYLEASDGLVQIPVYPPKFAIPFGSALIGLQMLRDAWKRFQSLITPG